MAVMRRLAVLVATGLALGTVGCNRDTADPRTDTTLPAPTRAAIRVTLPQANSVLSDTILDVAGTAEAPGEIQRVDIWPRRTQEVGSVSGLGVEVFSREASEIRTSRISFSKRVTLPAGVDTFAVRVIWATRDAAGKLDRFANYDTSVVFRVYRQPRVEIEAPDTVYGASLTLDAGLVDGITQRFSFDSLIVDPGPARRRIVASGSPPGFVQALGTAPRRVTIYSPYTFEPGEHVARVYFTDDLGTRVAEKRFVTVLPDAPYRITFLGNLPNGSDSDANDVNAAGVAVGWSNDASGTRRAVVWRDAAIARLDTVTATFSIAYAINAAGVIVGGSSSGGTAVLTRPIRWINGQREVLPSAFTAVDVNDDGVVLMGPSLWDNVQTTVIPGMTSGVDVNLRRQVVGYRSSSAGQGAAVFGLTPPSAVLAPGGSFYVRSSADALNERGQFAGVMTSVIGAVYFSEEGKGSVSLVQAFGPSGCYRGDLATQICADLAVGGLTESGTLLVQETTSKTVYLWQDFRTRRVRLDTSAWTVDQVHAINASGVIVGHGVNTDTGQRGAVLLTPR
jgi:uncharacterized membrane protein